MQQSEYYALGSGGKMATFRSEDVQQILQRAMAHQQETEFSEQQLAEMAKELGISADALHRAQQDWHLERDRFQVQQTKRIYHQQKLRGHVLSYVLINSFLVLLNLFSSPRYFWAVYPLLGWGLGLGFHVASVYSGRDTPVVMSGVCQPSCKG